MHTWRYDHLTWPEMNEALARDPQPVVLIPFGAVEDHGPHLPLSTDNDILAGILNEVGHRANGDILILPTIPFGLDEHHMDFPGTIAVDIETCLAYVSQVAISVARHGFKHILIVNGHGSNHSIADLAARQCVIKTGAKCGAVSPNAAIDASLCADVLEKGRRGGPGSVSHACEYETAMMLHLQPDLVQMDQAERDIGQPAGKYFSWDRGRPSPIMWQDWWSRISRTGIAGDASVATAEFGHELWEVTVERFIELCREFRSFENPPRVDHHVKRDA